MSTTLQESLEAGEHQKFKQLIGEWEGATRTWFEPGDPVDESNMKGSIRPLFDGRFVMHEYSGSFQGKPFEGLAIYAYHLLSQTYQCSWVDTFHMGTGIMFSEGAKGGAFYSTLGHYSSGGDSPEQWGWRTEINVVDEDNIVLSAFNITPGGEETKATETNYKRVKGK